MLYKYGITGDVVATTYGHNPNGYMMFVGGKGKLFVVVDTKNNRVATVEYYRGPYAGLDKLINGAPVRTIVYEFWNFRIFDDTRDGDAKLVVLGVAPSIYYLSLLTLRLMAMAM